MELALDLCDEIVILNNGKLTLIDRESLSNKELKDKIIDVKIESEHLWYLKGCIINED